MLAMLLLAFWFRASATLSRLATYSFISVLTVFISGGLAAFAVATGSPIAGLLERITIGGFLQWLLVVALELYAQETPMPEPNRAAPILRGS